MGKSNDSNSFLTNMITSGTSIVGNVTCTNDIRIEGTLQGNLTVKGKLVLGATGNINGEIICQNCDVEGKIDGKITVQELLSLRSTAKVEGDVDTAKLAIEPGALFSGTCNMNQKLADTKK